jgi:predicted MFS family arabinose efflux permease
MTGRTPALAMLAAGVNATAVLVSLPVLAAGMAAQAGGGERAIGVLASADMAGSAVASLAVLPFIARVNWRTLALVAMLVVIAGNAWSAVAGGFASLAAARALTGAGSGLVVALTFAGLCHSANPDRYFGLYVLAQLLLQALLMWMFPIAIDASGMWLVYAVLAAGSAASTLLVPYFPRTAADAGIATATGRPPGTSRAGVTGLAGQAVYFIAAGAAWSYLEPIGTGFGLDAPAVGRTLSAAAFAGITGALLVITLAAWLVRWQGLVAGTLASAAAAVLLSLEGPPVQFVGAAALFTLAWNFTFPWQMGLLAQFDHSGGIAVASLVVQLFALAAGPLLAAAILPVAGYAGILWSGAGLFLASLALFAVASRRGAR